MNHRVVRAAFQQSYQCPSCTARQTRVFSSSPTSRLIGPESPRYIDFPEPPQQTSPPRQRLRGILPVPRDIFSGNAPGKGMDKADPEYLDLATKEPKNRRAHALRDDRLAWKERMAETRRRNLREGIIAMRDRKIKQQTFLTQRSKQRQEEREALLAKPEREDERLTSPTIELELQKLLETASIEDPDRGARLAAMRARVAQKAADRDEAQTSALHALYLNAREFIVNEAQLTAAIDQEFGTDQEPRVWDMHHSDPSRSVWNLGRPATVQDMLNRANGKGGNGMSAVSSSTRGTSNVITKERITRMIEELTGGKTEYNESKP